MRTLLVLGIGLTCVWIVRGQADGRYRPILPYTTRRRPSVFDGRYQGQRPVGDGRYRANSDGRYRGASDGRYVPRNDGKYVHVDVPGGTYSGGGGKYTGGGGQYSGGGQYTGGGGQYTGGGGQYAGGGGQYSGRQNAGRGGQNAGGSRQNVGARGALIGSSGITTPRKPAVDLLASVARKQTIQGKGTGEGGGGWRTIRNENEVDADGYHYLYETENGILAEEQGRIESLTAGEQGLRSKGFFEYTGDDGLLYRVNYVADDNGFVPEGEHIPKAPPHVGKLLAYLAANAPTKRR